MPKKFWLYSSNSCHNDSSFLPLLNSGAFYLLDKQAVS
jgi:hypothetical protein